ncbi:hypothetical protein EVG20_g4730, partial [Dentipellis fragilis]
MVSQEVITQPTVALYVRAPGIWTAPQWRSDSELVAEGRAERAIRRGGPSRRTRADSRRFGQQGLRTPLVTSAACPPLVSSLLVLSLPPSASAISSHYSPLRSRNLRGRIAPGEPDEPRATSLSTKSARVVYVLTLLPPITSPSRALNLRCCPSLSPCLAHTMARTQMLSSEPTNIVPQPVSISHVQLRDVMLCPDEPGVVDFVQGQNILERDITDPSSTPTYLANLNFVPNTIASLPVPDSHERLVAAGGQEAELHLSLHSGHPSSARRRGSRAPVRSQRLWQYDCVLSGSINNSVLLTSLSLTRSHESSAEPRVAVSNNDCTVKFYDVNVRGSKGVDGPPKRISEAGTLRVDVPVNHSSISPDGRTLLSVGDSPQVYLHALTGGAQITFTQLSTLTLPPFDEICVPTYASALPACFSTAFSSCGTKFAVASQEGMVVVWDVRSYKPMKVFQTDRTRSPGRVGNNAASGWLYEDSWDWARAGSRAPGWGVRNVKFSPAGHGGKELMVFTEHTSLLHVIDATTFENEEIIRVPSVIEDSSARYTSQPPTPPVPESEAAAWASQIPRLPPVPPPQPRIVLYNARTGSTTDHTSRSAPGSSSYLSAHTATVSPARAHHYRRT